MLRTYIKRYIQLTSPRIEKCAKRKVIDKKGILNALKTGKVEEEYLKMFPDAYPAVFNLRTGKIKKDPLVYFLTEHNRIRNEQIARLKTLAKTPDNLKKIESIQKCKVVPARIIQKRREGFLVRDVEGGSYIASVNAFKGIKVVNEKKLKKNVAILIHDNIICMTLNPFTYRKTIRLYKKSFKG